MLRLSEAVLERVLTDQLGVAVQVGLAVAGAPPEALTPGERLGCRALTAPGRATGWLRGRAALKRLLIRSGQDPDTTRIAFPHPRFSLTHSGDYAVAVGAVGLAGIGVDFEARRLSPADAARWVSASRVFLTGAEQRWLRQQNRRAQARELIRLWTVKEALFKADADNRRRCLADYALGAPDTFVGRAHVCRGRGPRMRYCSIDVAPGMLTVALAREGE